MNQNMEVRVNIACSGAPDSLDLTITLPSSLHVDTTFSLGTGAAGNFGTGIAYDSGSDLFPLVVCYNNTTSVAVRAMIQSVVVPVRTANVSQTMPFTFGASDTLQVVFDIPILEWA